MNTIATRLPAIVLLLVAWLTGAWVQAKPVTDTDPYNLLQQVAENTFGRLKAEQPQIRKQPDLLKKVVDEELMPYVDYKYAAYKVIGPALRDTTREQRDEFAEAFREYLITTYAQVLTQYNDQDLRFEPHRDIGEDKFVDIKVAIIEPGREDIDIGFKLRRQKSGQWQAYDMVAEGVSLLSAKQSELGGMIRTDGIDKVAKLLREKSQVAIKFGETSGKVNG